MARDAEVFSALAALFAPTTREEWTETTAGSPWQAFVDELRRLSHEGVGSNRAPSLLRRPMPLRECLSNDEVSALYAPPSYDEHHRFIARHFTGGLPTSALPVESLYTVWSNDPRRSPFSETKPMHQGDAALYMKDLLGSLGLAPSEDVDLAPDHISLELATVAELLNSSMVEEAKSFLIERFSWLTDYRARLLQIGKEATFYIALVDTILCIRAVHEQQAAQTPQPTASSA